MLFLSDVLALVHKDELVSAGHEDDGEDTNSDENKTPGSAKADCDGGNQCGIEGDILHFKNTLGKFSVDGRRREFVWFFGFPFPALVGL